MAYFVGHCEKYKADNLGGLQRHEDRLNSKYGNENIDINRIKDNYYPLGEKQATTYKERVQGVLDKYGVKPWNNDTRTGVKKDSVLLCAWVFSASGELFANMPRYKQEEFFTRVCDFVADKIGGKDKLVNAVVHFDETTPHLHLSYVPVLEAKEGKTGYRLSCKDMNNRQFLRAIQNDLPRYLKGFGFDVERGQEGNGTKHKTPRQYKQEQAQKQEELKPVVNALQGLQTSEHIKEGLFRSGAEFVKIPLSVYDSTVKALKEHGATLQENIDLKSQIAGQGRIKEQKKKAVEELQAVKQELKQAKEKIERLEADTENTYNEGITEGRKRASYELEHILLQARKTLEQAEAEAQSRTEQAQKELIQARQTIRATQEQADNYLKECKQKAFNLEQFEKQVNTLAGLGVKLGKANRQALNNWVKQGQELLQALEKNNYRGR